jgi:fumarate hydratase subunit alpha
MEKAALLSKQALLRNANELNTDPYYADLEKKLLDRLNKLGIGPMGLGGRTTVLGVNIMTYPTHIAGLPVAVNICCHVNRHIKVKV